jgi:hypothetical protein
MKAVWFIFALVIASLLYQPAHAECVRAAPTLIPTERTTESLANETRTVEFTLKNNDNINCSAASYNYQPRNSERWTSSVSGGSLSNIPNGSNTSINITVNPEDDIEDGEYFTIPIFIHLQNQNLNASGKITYRIKPSPECTKGIHAIGLQDAAKSGNAGTAQSYQVFVNNTDNPKCNSMYYNISATIVNPPASGKFTINNPPIQKVRANTSATFSVTITPNQDVPPAEYTIKFEAHSINNHLNTQGTLAVSPTSAQSMSLTKGWNHVSSPTDGGITLQKIRDRCGPTSALWYLDPLAFKYDRATIMFPHLGYWVKVPGDCSITVDTNIKLPYIMALAKTSGNPEGKNMISANGNWPSLKGSCILREDHGGRWDNTDKVLKNETQFEPKRAYRVKINESCTLQFYPQNFKLKVPSVSCTRSSDSAVSIQFTVKNELDTEIAASSITTTLKHPEITVGSSLSHSSILPQESAVVTHTLSQGSSIVPGGYYIFDYAIGGQTVKIMSLCPRAANGA